MAVPRPGFEEVVVDPVQLGRYVLLDPIAHGRTGVVHRACLRRDDEQDELLAIKLVSHELLRDRRDAEHFVEVVGRVAQLEHPEHCTILDFDLTPDGSLYVAMELVAGKDLGRVATQLDEIGRSMPPQLVAHVGAQIAGALHAAHAMQAAGAPAPLHHGELAPSDILIGYDGRVRLTGLGSVELGLASPRASYRAPELARGGACTAQSDVFSLAACLYEVLAGRPAFSLEHGSGAHGRRRPESHITKVIPRPLERILTRALNDQPEARWPSAAEFGGALASWSAAQSGRADTSALAMFMISIFDAAIADEDARLRAWLARAPTAQPRPKAAPSSPALPDRNSYARLVRASARPMPSEELEEWNDPAEHTPARGLLMRKLAADMIDKLGAAGAAAPSRSVPTHPTAGLGFADLLSDESWEEEKPVGGWISESEERANSAPPPVAPPASTPPAAAARPRLPPKPVRAAPKRYPRASVDGIAPAPRRGAMAVPAIPIEARDPEPAPRPVAVSAPSYGGIAPALLGGALSGAPAPATARRRGSRWLAPALATGALALALAAFVVLRTGGTDRSTLHVRTRPSGAEVLLRGERLGTTPLTRDGLASGAAALELHAPGFETASRTIQLQSGKAAHFDVDLIRRASTAAASNAATREADLQSQLAARSSPQLAEPAAAGGDGVPAADREGRSRRRPGAASRDPEADAPEAVGAVAPVELSVTRSEAVLELKPAPEPQAVSTAPAPTSAAAKPAMGGIAPAPRGGAMSASATAAPAKAAPAARASRGPTRAPVLVQQTMPRFPARARRMGVTQGVVTLEFTINAAGQVTDALVLKADPPALFDEAAMRAIERWRYEPKLEGGTPVASRHRYTFRFLEE